MLLKSEGSELFIIREWINSAVYLVSGKEGREEKRKEYVDQKMKILGRGEEKAGSNL